MTEIIVVRGIEKGKKSSGKKKDRKKGGKKLCETILRTSRRENPFPPFRGSEMAPGWPRLLSKRSKPKVTGTVSVHASSVTAKRDEIEGAEAREKAGVNEKRASSWRQSSLLFRRRRRRRQLQPPPSHQSVFVLALVFFSLGMLLVSGIASSFFRSKAAAATASVFSLSSSSSSSFTASSYAPPKNWTSPPAAVRVVDGDTVVAAGITVRLLGMDAPEDGQLCSRRNWGLFGARRRKEELPSSSSLFFSRWPFPPTSKQIPSRSTPYDCGAESTRALRSLVAGKPLRCERKGTDRYGRALARCFVDRRGGFFSFFCFSSSLFPPSFFRASNKSSSSSSVVDIGEWMLREGHAVSFMGFTGPYLEAERKAKEERKGIWAGEFEPPKVWREKRRIEREARARKKKEKEMNAIQKKKKVASKRAAAAAAAAGSSSGRGKQKTSKKKKK